MRRVLMTALLVLAPTVAQAQQRTLIDGPIRSGGFGAPVVKGGDVAGLFGIFAGGRGGWIINDAFVLGAGGYGLTNQWHLAADALEMGYGGLDLEYVNRPNEVVHISLGVLIGGGGATYYPGTDPIGFYSGFFVAEPAVNVLVNVTPIFRIGLGATYRAVEWSTLPELSDRDLSGFTGQIQLKFGKFVGT